MTREEALQKMIPIERMVGWSPASGSAILDVLEALGVITFEKFEDRIFKKAGEDLAGIVVNVHAGSFGDEKPAKLTQDGAYEVLDYLRKCGYRLVKE